MNIKPVIIGMLFHFYFSFSCTGQYAVDSILSGTGNTGFNRENNSPKSVKSNDEINNLNSDSIRPVQTNNKTNLNPEKTTKSISKHRGLLKKRVLFSGEYHSTVSYGQLPVYFQGEEQSFYHQQVGKINFSLFIPLTLKFEVNNFNSGGLNCHFDLNIDQEQLNRTINEEANSERAALNNYRDSLKHISSKYKKRILFLEKYKDFATNKLKLPQAIQSEVNIPSGFGNDSLLTKSDTLKLGDFTSWSSVDDTNALASENNRLEEPISGKIQSDLFDKTSLDTGNINMGNVSFNGHALDSISYAKNHASDTTNSLDDYALKIDSVNKLLGKYKGMLDSTENLLKSSDPKSLKYRKPGFGVKNFNLFKLARQVKQFHIGYFEPYNSVFLINNSLVRGFEIEMEGSLYFSLVNGVIVDRNFTRNVANEKFKIFDVFSLKKSALEKRVTAVKFGIGPKGKNHLHFGLLWAKGSKNSVSFLEYNSTIKKNVVAELEGRFYAGKKVFIDINYARSVLANSPRNSGENKISVNSLLEGKYSAAYYAKLTGEIKQFRSTVYSSIWYVEPFFSSLGNEYLQSDLLRLEMGTKSQISRRLKLQVRYRSEKNNLHNLMAFSFQSHNTSANANIKVSKKVVATLILNPIFYQTTGMEGFKAHYTNLVSSAILNYMVKIKESICPLSVVYVNYLFKDFSGSHVSHVINLQQSIHLSERVQLLTGVGFQQINNPGYSYSMEGIEGGIGASLARNTKVDATVKLSLLNFEDFDYGASMRLTQKLFSFLTGELAFEKYNRQAFGFFTEQNMNSNQFPYMVSCSLKTKW